MSKKRTFTLTYLRLLALVAVSAAIASFVTVGVTTNIFDAGLSDHVQESIDRLDDTVVDSCNTYNIQDGIQILDAKVGQEKDPPDVLVDKVFTIADCEATVEAGQVVPLVRAQKEQFLRVLSRGRNPVVEDGKVVGYTQFE